MIGSALDERLALLEELTSRAIDMLFTAAGALEDREMPKMASAVSDLAMEMLERREKKEAQ